MAGHGRAIDHARAQIAVVLDQNDLCHVSTIPRLRFALTDATHRYRAPSDFSIRRLRARWHRLARMLVAIVWCLGWSAAIAGASPPRSEVGPGFESALLQGHMRVLRDPSRRLSLAKGVVAMPAARSSRLRSMGAVGLRRRARS